MGGLFLVGTLVGWGSDMGNVIAGLRRAPWAATLINDGGRSGRRVDAEIVMAIEIAGKDSSHDGS